MSLAARLTDSGPDQYGNHAVKSDEIDALLYVIIQLGSYTTPNALKAGLETYLGTEHRAVQLVERVRRDGDLK
jgi:hypothetical protein